MKWARILLTVSLALIICVDAQAQPVVETFDNGFPGTAINGWTNSWNYTTGISTPTVVSSSPLLGGGNYLDFEQTAASDTALRRTFNGGLSVTDLVIHVDYRVDALTNFATTSDYVTLCDGSSPSTGGASSSSTFIIRAFGAAQSTLPASEWGLYNGQKNGGSYNANNFVDSGMPLTVGTVYSFTVTIHPATLTYDVAISNATTGVSTTNSGLGFRAGVGTFTIPWTLVFNSRISNAKNSEQISVDSIWMSNPGTNAYLPTITLNPQSQSSYFGQTVSFNVGASSTSPLYYQWQVMSNGFFVPITDGGQFSGSKSNALIISNIGALNATNYNVIISNYIGSVTSAVASLTLVAGSPSTITNSAGASVSVGVNGAYLITVGTNGWTFAGSLGATPGNFSSGVGSDGIGAYTELSFQFTNGTPQSAGIRLYTNQPVVLFSDTFLNAGANNLAFPNFTTSPASGLYHMGYAGPFGTHDFSTFQADSPWIFFDTNYNTFIISAATNYTISSDSKSGGALACGINSAISQLPAGFTHRAMLVFGNGINNTYNIWGNTLTGLAGKKRPANDSAIELNKLGYWTDAGASYYYNYNSTLGYAGTLLAVANEYATKGVSLGYLQLDSWWYPKSGLNTWQGSAGNNRGGIYLYVAAPDLFPNGLASFQQQLGLPLIAHSRWIDTASPYRTNYLMSLNMCIDPVWWTNVISYIANAGVVTYEQDWLQQDPTAMNLNDPPAFLNNMSAAAGKYGLNIQYCTPNPFHYLQQTLYTNVNTIRVCNDNFDTGNWDDFIYGCCLAYAVECWPFSDNFMSSESRNLLISTLSAGPVGTGDALGAVNATNLQKTIRSDSVIVKPDVPLMPLDQTYVNDAQAANKPMVASALSDHNGMLAAYVFSYARTSRTLAASFIPASLGITNNAYVYNYFAGTGTIVTNGNTFTFTTTALNNASGDSYFVVVPIGLSGIALVGDTNKYVCLGKKRVSSLTDKGFLRTTIVYAAGESNVTLFGYAPTAPYATPVSGTVMARTYDPINHCFSIQLAPSQSGTCDVVLSLVPMPTLQITLSGGEVVISWPASATGFFLQNTPSLNTPVNWAVVTNNIATVNGTNIVTLAINNQNTFYRLIQ